MTIIDTPLGMIFLYYFCANYYTQQLKNTY